MNILDELTCQKCGHTAGSHSVLGSCYVGECTCNKMRHEVIEENIVELRETNASLEQRVKELEKQAGPDWNAVQGNHDMEDE